jgi:hypothetical protein
MDDSTPTDYIAKMVQEILDDLTLKEKHEIAQMGLDDMDILEEILALYLDAHGLTVMGQKLVVKVWEKVRDTHQLKVVK